MRASGTTHKRVVAQFGSALDWGSRGRWFESSPPDHERAGQRLKPLTFFLIHTIYVLQTVFLVSSEVHFYLFSRREKLFGERLQYASSYSIAISGMRQFARPHGAPKPACAHEVRPPFGLSPSHSGSPTDKCPGLYTQHTNHRPALCILGLGACEGTVASWGVSL